MPALWSPTLRRLIERSVIVSFDLAEVLAAGAQPIHFTRACRGAYLLRTAAAQYVFDRFDERVVVLLQPLGKQLSETLRICVRSLLLKLFDDLE